ncbi:hypothetical protein KKG41_01420 [Patescibacteria group bacterium]|nr:hypothetical protein [Patescibacteria group bacterium]MBU1890576.1 hypothetical protein [Patescibacteria group bacterium]
MKQLLKNRYQLFQLCKVSLFILFAVLTLTGSFITPAHANESGFAISEEAQAELGLTADLEPAVLRIIKWVFGFIGLVAFIIVIYGGFTWMTAAGNEEKVESAKKTITAAVIGIIIIILSLAIVTFVFKGVSGGPAPVE